MRTLWVAGVILAVVAVATERVSDLSNNDLDLDQLVPDPDWTSELGEVSDGSPKTPDPFPTNYYKIPGKGCGTTVQCAAVTSLGEAAYSSGYTSGGSTGGSGTTSTFGSGSSATPAPTANTNVPGMALTLTCSPTTCPLDGCAEACDACDGCKAFVYDGALGKCKFMGVNSGTCDAPNMDTYKKCEEGSYATGGASSCSPADDWKVKVASYTSGDALTAKTCPTEQGSPLAAIGSGWMTTSSPASTWSFSALSAAGMAIFGTTPTVTTPCSAAACPPKVSQAVSAALGDAPVKVEIKTTGDMGWFMEKICIWSVKRGKKYTYSIPTWMNPLQTCIKGQAGCNHACSGNYNTGGTNATQAWKFNLNEGDGACL